MRQIPLPSIPHRPPLAAAEIGELLRAYQQSLERREEVYERVRQDFSGQLECGPACNDCCHQVFLIRMLDLFWVRQPWTELSPQQRRSLRPRIQRWQSHHAALPPGLVVGGPEDLGALAALEHSLPTEGPPCPLLTPGQGCSIYPRRPALCRSYGYPELAMDGKMCCGCPKNLVGVSSDAMAAYTLPARRYLEIADLEAALLEALGVPGWKGFVVATGLVVPLQLDPLAIDWPALLT